MEKAKCEKLKRDKFLKECKKKSDKVFPAAVNHRVGMFLNTFWFEVYDYLGDKVTFANLKKLSEIFGTDLINIRGDADCDCESCGSDPYCVVKITLENK